MPSNRFNVSQARPPTGVRTRRDGDVPAIAFEARMAGGFDHSDPSVLGERSMILVPRMHPDLALTLDQSGATRLSENTWVFGLDQYSNMGPLRAIVSIAKPGTIMPYKSLVTPSEKLLTEWWGRYHRVNSWSWSSMLVLEPEARAVLSGIVNSTHATIRNAYNSPQAYHDACGFVSVSSNGRSLYISAVTMEADIFAVEGEERLDPDLVVSVNLRQPGRSNRDPRPSTPAAVLQTTRALKALGAEVLYAPEAKEVLAKLENSVTMYPAPGRPAEIAVVVGDQVTPKKTFNGLYGPAYAKALAANGDNNAIRLGTPVRYGVRSISEVESVITELEESQTQVFIHPKVEDLYRLVKAEPVDDPKMREYQREAVGRHMATKYGFVNALEPGMGKALKVSAGVLTPTGWRQIGDLTVGDLVIGSDGRPAPVTGVYPQGELDMFRVTFSDGSSVVASGDHLWSVRRKTAKAAILSRRVRPGEMTSTQRFAMCKEIEAGSTITVAAKRAGVSRVTASKWNKRYKSGGEAGLEGWTPKGLAWQTMETRDLQKQIRNTTGDRLWSIPMTAPVHLEHPGPRPVPAYVLGVILGDGGLTQGSVVVYSGDEDMAGLLRQELTAPMQVRVRDRKGQCPALHLKTEPPSAANPVRKGLKELGLSGLRAENKFVPDAYLYAPLEERIALFQGLLDTDGYYDEANGVLQFYSTSERLADAVAFLVESFGGNARRTAKQEPTYRYNGEIRTGLPCYKVTITLPTSIAPFRLKRKVESYQPRAKYLPTRIIESIEPEGREEAVCISVAAEDQLYLTEHCIVTHNTITTLGAMARRAKTIPQYRGLVVAEANVRSQWADEARTWAPDIELVTVYGAEDASKLETALESRDGLLVITSYSMAGRIKAIIDAEEAEAEAAKAAAEAAKVGPKGRKMTATEAAIAEALRAAREGKLGTDISDEKVSDETGSDETSSDDGNAEVKSFDAEIGEQGLLFTESGEPSEVALVGAEEVERGDATVGELLDRTYWHDLIADEAAVLRNPGSGQSKSLWRLRGHSEIAMALTGTPITRNGVDDLGRLIAWTRNDAQMFHGAKLSSAFDVATDEGMHRFQDAVGVLVFRRNKSDIAEELPGLATEVVMLEPTAQELALAAAAREELKRVYLELVALMEMVEEGSPDDPRVAEAKAAMKAARGAWLGGTQLARMAAADPAALLRSESAGAELLRGSGLIDAANRRKGTKRSWVLNHTRKRVEDGHQVIVFTEFATVAEGLIADLEDAGVAVGGILGGGGKARDRNVEAFRDGQLDVLVATSAGKRGLNLQTAATVIHYDLPWTPDDVAQRTARVERIGATADEVEVLFVVAKGTIEERVVALLATRAATAVRALDVSRGADGSTTDMGRILAGLMPAVDGAHLDEGQWSMLEITRDLVGA